MRSSVLSQSMLSQSVLSQSVLSRSVDRAAALIAPLGTAAAGMAGLALVAFVDPNQPGRYPTCPFLAVTGHWCPGCGSLRAMHAVATGDIHTALGFNVLTVLALPLLAVLWWRWIRRRWQGKARPAPVRPVYLWVMLAGVLVFWLVRNLPMGAALAP